MAEFPDATEAQLELTRRRTRTRQPGRYTIAVKVIDIFGNDTMTLVPFTVVRRTSLNGRIDLSDESRRPETSLMTATAACSSCPTFSAAGCGMRTASRA